MPPASSEPSPAPAIRGHCSPPALAELIRDLYLDERNGNLILWRSGVEKRVALDRGMILRVASSLEDEKVPVFLAQHGVINPEEAEALKGLDDRQAGDALRKMLKEEKDARARRSAACAVGNFGPDAADAVPDLVTALGHKDALVRQNVAWALGRIGGAEAAAALRSALAAEEDGEVRAEIEAALDELQLTTLQ